MMCVSRLKRLAYTQAIKNAFDFVSATALANNANLACLTA